MLVVLSPADIAVRMTGRRITNVFVCGITDIPDNEDMVSLFQSEAYVEVEDLGLLRVYATRNDDGLACEIVSSVQLDDIAEMFPDLRPIRASIGSNLLGEGPKRCVSVSYRPGDPRDEGFVSLLLLLENEERIIFEGQWTFGMRTYVVPPKRVLSGELYVDLSP